MIFIVFYLAMGDYKEYRKKLNEIIAVYGPVERDVTKLYELMVSQSRMTAGKGGKYGYLDKNFKEKTEFIYDGAMPVYEGIGAVQKGSKWALINRNGELVTDFIYDEILCNTSRRDTDGAGSRRKGSC